MRPNDRKTYGATHSVPAQRRTPKALLEQCFGVRRFVYNQQVEAFNTYDREMNPKPEYPNVTDYDEIRF